MQCEEISLLCLLSLAVVVVVSCTRNVACEHSGFRKPRSIMGAGGYHRLGRELVTRTAVHSGGLVRTPFARMN
jgi:hypothetical protein